MKTKNSPYLIAENYYLRSPLLPLKFYTDFLEAPSFVKLIENHFFMEALYLASPSLYKQIIRWENQEIKDPKKIRNLKYSLIKYISRISSRCTPFGLFAGCAVGEFNSQTNIQLDTLKTFGRFTKLDMTFLNTLKEYILSFESVKKKVLFFPNNSIYRVLNNYRYVEYSIDNNNRTYNLQEFESFDYIDIVIKKAVKGETIESLSESIISSEVTKKEAHDFIEELIENQILTSELESTVTGIDYFQKLLLFLSNIQTPFNESLLKINDSLNKIDKSFFGNLSNYTDIQNHIKKMGVSYSENKLFQTDTYLSLKKNHLSYKVKKEVKKSLLFFNAITPTYEFNRLEKFKKDFTNRYEDEKIPLSMALDAEIGISYGQNKEDYSAILENLQSSRKALSKTINWNEFDALLLKKYTESIKEERTTIVLKSKDFINKELNWDDLPDTSSAVIEVYKNNQIFIDGIGGSSASNLLGRFTYNDPNLKKITQEIITAEEILNHNSILAEIVHLPQVRTGNILHRENIRPYEIPYVGLSSVSSKNQIPISDLLIFVRNNIIILWSKKLNTEIKPRLSNAHNYSYNSLPIYHFLCDLQHQNKRSSIGFSWNTIFNEQPFLPRVQLDQTIISKARWKILVKDFKEHYLITKSFTDWKKKINLPNYVQLVEGDNKLLISLTNTLSIEMLRNTIKNRRSFILEEFLFHKDEVVTDKIHSYCNQVIVSFIKKHI